MPNAKYDRDFYAWANEQAALLRAGEYRGRRREHRGGAERLGRTEKREFVSRLTALFALLLKAQFLTRKRSPSWKEAITLARAQVLEHLDDNPSLKEKLPETIASAFRNARRSAVDETGPDDGAFPSPAHGRWSRQSTRSSGRIDANVAALAERDRRSMRRSSQAPRATARRPAQLDR